MSSTNETGFAVVELFTSEGCSSCPPADELIEKIHNESEGQQVYMLAYHIDYWDRLGWRDVFSSSRFTERQEKYAVWLSQTQLYTPQAIVNGQQQFVGSDERQLRNAISNGLSIDRLVKITLSDLHNTGDRINIRYQIQYAGEQHSLILNLVQKHALTSVKNGENAGQTLRHVQIVRDIRAVYPVNHTGTAGFILQDQLTNNTLEIIAFVQDNNNGHIVAAAKSDLSFLPQH